jgi:eukaryotic-like serine/threonine-protein kinase
MDDHKTIPGTCPRCGKSLPKDAPEGMCAACLFEAGAETLTSLTGDEPTIAPAHGEAVRDMLDGQRLEPGQSWGPYRIGRLLGKGGMGEVYEAEHTESGRRIALKVLRSRLEHAEDRARFLREGQLAASVSHPHTVYIFGSEEIAGMPVISMELLPGGTLKDRVVAQGPLPPTEAVSAVLDIIGGLDAAQSSGILHRDIKPSNCFLDNEGSVKVGDFGLSISTLARDVHRELETGGFQGTPQFAAPEQLRGEPLDVRADIYAVGATLYYLLTGRPPLEARDLRELVARVTNEPPKSPRLVRKEIPPGLASIVLQCLAKSPAARPPSYAALADALRPFSAGEDVPARPGFRLVAAIVDSLIVGVPISSWIVFNGSLLTQERGTSGDITAWIWLVNLAYYVLLEGLSGASLGKRLFGLRVTSSDGSRASLSRVALRTAAFYGPSLLFGLVVLTGVLQGSTMNAAQTALPLFIFAALFFTARRYNGWAGVHELISGTRVVSRKEVARQRLGAQTGITLGSPEAGHASAGPSYGPFTVVSKPRPSGDGQLVLGFDSVLRRHVWIHTVPPNTPAIDAARRDVGRTGRLFWLTGRRSTSENWDAFEAPDGEAFLARKGVAPWSTLKLWLMDLANELTASEQDRTTPGLGTDRLWIRGDGRLVLLDFPVPGTGSIAKTSVRQAEDAPVGLLSAVAAQGFVTGSANGQAPLPLSARALLNRLSDPKPPTLEEARATLADVIAAPDRTQRWRRAIPIGLASTPTLFVVLLSLLVLPPLYSFIRENGEMLGLLEALRQPNPPRGSRLSDPVIRDGLERYLAGRYGTVLRDESFWRSAIMQRLSDRRSVANEILERHPSVSEEELAQARTLVAREIQRAREGRNPAAGVVGIGIVIMGALGAFSLLLVVGCSIVSVAVVPGGVLTRSLGLAAVTTDGKEITRWRSMARTLLAWLPAIVWLIALGRAPKIAGWVPAAASMPWGLALTAAALIAGAVRTIARPARGPHDWLTGTWVVPR